MPVHRCSSRSKLECCPSVLTCYICFSLCFPSRKKPAYNSNANLLGRGDVFMCACKKNVLPLASGAASRRLLPVALPPAPFFPTWRRSDYQRRFFLSFSSPPSPRMPLSLAGFVELKLCSACLMSSITRRSNEQKSLFSLPSSSLPLARLPLLPGLHPPACPFSERGGGGEKEGGRTLDLFI